MSKAKAETVTGIFPVTTYTSAGKAVPPGEKNTISKAVADEIEKIHGKYDAPDAGKVKATSKTVEVPVADLGSDVVKKAIADAEAAAKAEALTDVKAAWEAFATLPDDASDDAVAAAEAAISKALGVDAA